MFDFSKIACILLAIVHIGQCRLPYRNNDIANKDKLIFAHTICRHGDRNIQVKYPNDPLEALSDKPWASAEGLAQLTNIGKEQHYQLGQYFRKRYSSLLGNGAYSADKVYVRATDVDRVIMSALANLAGLFPPSYNQVWNKRFNWSPIPVHTQPLNDDYLVASDKQCDRFDYLMFNYVNETVYNGLFKKYETLISFAEEKSGMKLSTLTAIVNLYDTLLIEQLKGAQLPKWADKLMEPNSDFIRLALFWFQFFTPTAEMKKLKMGYLLKEILDRFTSKTQSTLSPDRSLWMYFAHDTTICSMLNTLGRYELHHPPYASCVLFELYQGNEEPYVQIFYRNSTKLLNPPALDIPDCGTKCSLKNMYKLYDDVLPKKSFAEECVLRQGEKLPPGGNPETNSL